MTTPFKRGPRPVRTANPVTAVHHSFWSSLQAKGFSPRNASLCAWSLIKAAYPAMNGAAEAQGHVSELPLDEQVEMLEMVEKAIGSPRMTDSERQAVLRRVAACLQSHVDATRLGDRLEALRDSGMTPSDAAAQARAELGALGAEVVK